MIINVVLVVLANGPRGPRELEQGQGRENPRWEKKSRVAGSFGAGSLPG